MPAVRKVSMQQMEVMVSFMEEHRALAKGQAGDTPQAKASVKRLWEELAALLNGQRTGTTKMGTQWRDYWRDIKYRVRQKAAKKEMDRRRTGRGPPSSVGLSPLEERIYSIMGDRSVEEDVSVKIPFDFDEVPPTPADVDSQPSPVHCFPCDPLSSQVPPCSPAQPQPSTSTAPPVHTSVEILQPRWAWEAEQRRLAVDERRLAVDERRLALDDRRAALGERVMAVQERMASSLEAIAGELAIIRADTAAIRQFLEL